MAKHLNLSTIVDKNKVDSDKAFLVMFKVDVKDQLGATINTLRFVKNSENVTFNGDLFVAGNFDINITMEAQSEPSVSITAQDQTRSIQSYLDLYDGLVNSDITMYVVHEDSLDGPAEMEETFLVTNASANDYVVNFELGVEGAVSKRFPNYRQFTNRCMWKYKGLRCKYSGPMATCDFTRDGANGCVAHNNEINFGGFPGLKDLM